MQKNFNHQKGLTTGGLLIVLFLVGFFALLGVKIIPLYMDNIKLSGSLKALKETSDLTNQSASEIKGHLSKQFNMNYVDFINTDQIEVVSTPGYVKVSANYERVTPVFANISVLINFEEFIEVGSK